MNPNQNSRPARMAAEFASALRSCRTAFWGAAMLSGLVNILYLTGSFFMLTVYDRVLPSHSVPTLVALLALALVLYGFQGLLGAIRARILVRIGAVVDEALSPRVVSLVLRAPLKGAIPGDGLLPLRDLDQIRSFLGGMGPSALFDMPWLPIYVALCFVFHPLLGLAAIAGALVLAALALATDRVTSGRSKLMTEQSLQRNGLAEAGRRNAEVLAAMGMHDRFAARWQNVNSAYSATQQALADGTGALSYVSQAFRTALQSAVLALAAFLVIHGDATAGVLVASSILVARALAPAELAIAHWRGFVQARQAWNRLNDLLARLPAETQRHTLPTPCRSLVAEGVCVAPPASQNLVVQNVSFALSAGQAVGVIGPSASGKSSLARSLIGLWPAVRGKVRLDGAALDQWSEADLGPHIGFLPQEVELFEGTIADNIARFETDCAAEVTSAAMAAGAHDMILRLPEGYDTKLESGGRGLSAGQRQRIGLARALYGAPFLVVLDEPNANLDGEGEAALTHAILGIRERGGICIVVAHRPSVLAAIDHVAVMAEGRLQAFGPRDEIMRRVMRPTAVPEAAPAAQDAPAAPDAPTALQA